MREIVRPKPKSLLLFIAFLVLLIVGVNASAAIANYWLSFLAKVASVMPLCFFTIACLYDNAGLQKEIGELKVEKLEKEAEESLK
jgi:hypothetical protein